MTDTHPEKPSQKTGVFRSLLAEIDSMIERDPAARSRLEVILCYPSLHALVCYRMARWLWVREWRLAGRWISQLGRWLTGIEIHPGATIGRNLFMDHGMGIVIGEASIIGDNVTLYHGVTLGGVSPSENTEDQRSLKRHPTIGDHVIIGSGAAVLGPVTVGRCARIGGNAVVVRDVPEKVTVVGIPAKPLHAAAADESVFTPYGTPIGDWPTDTDKQLQALLKHIHTLEMRIKTLESECGGGGTPNKTDDDSEEARKGSTP